MKGRLFTEGKWKINVRGQSNTGDWGKRKISTVSQGGWYTINNILLLLIIQSCIFLATQIKIWKCTDKNDLHSGLKYWQLYGVKYYCFLGTSSLHFCLWFSQPSWTAESLINVWDSNSITLNISPIESHQHYNVKQHVHLLMPTV